MYVQLSKFFYLEMDDTKGRMDLSQGSPLLYKNEVTGYNGGILIILL